MRTITTVVLTITSILVGSGVIIRVLVERAEHQHTQQELRELWGEPLPDSGHARPLVP